MEAIFLACGAGGPQLKRTPLGGKLVHHRLPSATVICLLACAPRPPQAADAYGVIDRVCRVYPADTLTLAEAHERYGVGCSPIVDPRSTPQYQSSRPTGEYGRVTLVLYGVRSGAADATLQRSGNRNTLQAQHLSTQEPGVELFFDSVPPGTYALTAQVGHKRYPVASFEIRVRELWELWFVPPTGG